MRKVKALGPGALHFSGGVFPDLVKMFVVQNV